MTDPFSAQCSVPGFGARGQEKLARARVLAIGLGGLSSGALPSLVAAGIGSLGIVDGDRVSQTNLHRQTLYNQNDVGQFKAPLAASVLQKLNPDLQLEVFTEYFTAENALNIAPRYDFILDLSDNYATHLLISDLARAMKKSVVMAAVTRFDGFIASFNPEHSESCLRCFLGRSVLSIAPQSCQETGIIGPVASLLGNLQAIEMVKLISHVGDALIDRILWCNLFAMNFKTYTLQQDPECCACHTSSQWQQHPRPIFFPSNACVSGRQLVADEFWASFQATTEAVLIDVRSHSEHKAVNLGGVNIPLDELMDQLANSTSNLKKILKDYNSPIYVYCQKGKRSAMATVALHQAGYNQTFALVGGLEGECSKN